MYVLCIDIIIGINMNPSLRGKKSTYTAYFRAPRLPTALTRFLLFSIEPSTYPHSKTEGLAILQPSPTA